MTRIYPQLTANLPHDDKARNSGLKKKKAAPQMVGQNMLRIVMLPNMKIATNKSISQTGA